MQKMIPVAVLVKGSSAVCHWKGKFASISKSHGAKTAYGAGQSEFKMASGGHL